MKTNHTQAELLQSVLQILRVNEAEILSWNIEKQSIDARKKPNIMYIYSICVSLKNEEKYWEKQMRKPNHNIQIITPKIYTYEPQGKESLKQPPIIVGAGPAGLFCAYHLAEQGYRPILLERGASVEERIEDVAHFWETGTLNFESNVQFGEGGAGTFSDGKLNTGVNDPYGRNKRVLEIFVANGAPESILYESKPHIGTDVLVDVVRNIRTKIIEMGGKVHFHTKMTGLDIVDNKVKGVIVNHEEYLESNVVVLAIGHSARDTFEYLYARKIPIEAKSFAVGVRVEHKQHIINESQYGKGYAAQLPAAPYKLTAKSQSGRGVYSFCMCPGGYVVNASSEDKHLAVNGMSYHDRNSKNANSAIVVTVSPEDYRQNLQGVHSPLDGMYFQRELESLAYQNGNGMIPIQLFGDYCNNIASTSVKSIIPEMKGKYFPTNLRQFLPSYIGDSIEEGMHIFGRKIKGFDHPETILSAIESRTSSPVRILRNERFQSDVIGIYPCGEGAGYAGGITSAAIDGIKVYEAIGNCYISTAS